MVRGSEVTIALEGAGTRRGRNAHTRMKDHVYTSCTAIELSRSNNNLLPHESHRRRRDSFMPRKTGSFHHAKEVEHDLQASKSTIPPTSRT
jgi:hypothetical protein